MNDKLSSALNSSVSSTPITQSSKAESKNDEESESTDEKPDDGEIVTTPAEIEAYTTVKIILRDQLDEERVFYRDNKSYFNVLLDDNIRKWILRVYFRKNRNWIELHDDADTQIDFVHPIDIYQNSEKIKDVVAHLTSDDSSKWPVEGIGDYTWQIKIKILKIKLLTASESKKLVKVMRGACC